MLFEHDWTGQSNRDRIEGSIQKLVLNPLDQKFV